ncbi:MAG: Vms1/Ankzf1 family peptidyl-tRNA hydrolase, partial [Desulfococcaceae bacterium]
MLQDIDLRALAEMDGPERAFVSAYLTGRKGLRAVEARADKIRALLEDDADAAAHFEESYRLIQTLLKEHPPEEGRGMCIFASYVLDFVQGHRVSVAVPDLLRLGPAPYIRPLARLQDTYEKFALVAADNTDTRIYLVAAENTELEDRVKGNIKNRVKKGGWSQKRYARRRKNELHHYAAEVAEVLEDLDRKESIDHIILMGSQETIQEIEDAFSEPLADKVIGETSADLDADTDDLVDDAYDLFFKEEREEDRHLWERIQGEYLADHPAAVGAEDVLMALLNGRVEHLLITQDVKLDGTRCRDCENVTAGSPDTCPYCKKSEVIPVDLVNELVRHAEITDADVDFT